MANVIIIEKVNRIAREIQSFIREMDPEHEVRIFDDSTAFEKKYFRNIPQEDVDEQSQNEKDDQDSRLSSLDIIIFKNQCIQGDIKEWVTTTQKKLKEFLYWPEGKYTRFIVIRFEEDETEKAKFMHPYIDDLICLPLDRLLFLQKFEIVLNMPGKVSPSFLYTQEVNMDIEISKKSKIERISDLGMAIRNPVNLKPGVLGHFFFKLPGQDETIDVWGKSIKTEKHPEIENQYLVYFNYLGLKKTKLTTIRKYLSSDTRYRQFKTEDPEEFTYNPDNIFLTEEQKKRKTVVVIDVNDKTSNSIKEIIDRNTEQLRVVASNSFYNFLGKYLDVQDSNKGPSKVLATNDDFYHLPVSWTFEGEDKKLVQVISAPEPDSTLLEYDAEELFSEPTMWHKLIKSEQAQTFFDEVTRSAHANGSATNSFELISESGDKKLVEVTIEWEGDTRVYKASLSPAPEQLLDKTDALESLDCLIIDHSYIPEDEINEWVDKVNAIAAKCGKLIDNKPLKIIVTYNPKTEIDIQKFRESKIFALIEKPVEIRGLIYNISCAAECSYTKYRFDNISWMDRITNVHIAKATVVEEVSEFGASFDHSTPIAVGTPLYLHGGIYENAPDGNLCARVYACDEESDHYLIHTLYYGINDTFLKFTRSWIREAYATKKEKASQA